MLAQDIMITRTRYATSITGYTPAADSLPAVAPYPISILPGRCSIQSAGTHTPDRARRLQRYRERPLRGTRLPVASTNTSHSLAHSERRLRPDERLVPVQRAGLLPRESRVRRIRRRRVSSFSSFLSFIFTPSAQITSLIHLLVDPQPVF